MRRGGRTRPAPRGRAMARGGRTAARPAPRGRAMARGGRTSADVRTSSDGHSHIIDHKHSVTLPNNWELDYPNTDLQVETFHAQPLGGSEQDPFIPMTRTDGGGQHGGHYGPWAGENVVRSGRGRKGGRPAPRGRAMARGGRPAPRGRGRQLSYGGSGNLQIAGTVGRLGPASGLPTKPTCPSGQMQGALGCVKKGLS